MNPEEREHVADRWLEEALGRYQAAPPRAGLEARILARLQERAEQRRLRRFYAFAFVTAAALCAMLAATVLNSRRNVVQPTAEVQASPAKTVKAQLQPANTRHAHERRGLVAKSRRKGGVEGNEAMLHGADVKQEIFPGASPPSEQKRLLQAYLSQTPRQELELVAERQRAARAISDLTIEPIEIKELTPIQDIEPKGHL